MHTYFVLLAVSQMREYVRLGALCCFLVLYITWDRWVISLYMAGAFIAQLHVLRTKYQTHSSPLPSTEQEASLSDKHNASAAQSTLTLIRSNKTSRTLRHLGLHFGLLFSLYLLSYPNLSNEYPSPGFEWLNPWIPSFYTWKEKFWPSVGTCLFLYLMTKTDTTSTYRRIFNHWWPQYLGRIMFAFVSPNSPFFSCRI